MVSKSVHMKGSKFLEGENVLLLQFEEEDAEKLSTILNLPSVRKPMIPATPQSPTDIKSYASEETEVFLTIFDKDSEEKIGHVELILEDKVARVGEIGYMVDPNHQGKGIATESVDLLVNYLFRELNLQKIKAETDEDNEGSKEVLKKNGFEKEATLEREKFKNGTLIGTEIYSIYNE